MQGVEEVADGLQGLGLVAGLAGVGPDDGQGEEGVVLGRDQLPAVVGPIEAKGFGGDDLKKRQVGQDEVGDQHEEGLADFLGQAGASQEVKANQHGDA